MNISRLIVGSTQGKAAQSFLAILALTATIAGSTAPANAQSKDSIVQEVSADRPISAASAKTNSSKHGVLIAAGEASTITWQNSLSKTLQLAKTNRKWILVDVFTDWCHWCKKLDSDVYAQPKVATFLNKSFVCMKANAEKGDGITVKSKYGVDGYPCTLILEPGGKEKGRIEGYLAPGDFAAEITRILNK